MGHYPGNIFLSRVAIIFLIVFNLAFVTGFLRPVSGLAAEMQISAGQGHTVGLKTDGTVVAVGYDYQGQTSVSDWSDIVWIAAGGFHTVGIKSGGTVVAVGSNAYGQIDVSEWTGLSEVSAGVYHTVGLKFDGTVVFLGPDWYDQASVSDWRNIISLAAGDWHTAGLKADGSVVAAGNYEYDQTNVSEWTDIIQVAAGGWHTVGVKSDGTVVAVGNNEHGQLNVSGWSNIIQVAAGGYHTIGLKADGTVVGVGFNECGEINVSEWSDMIQIAAGEYHTIGLKANGTVMGVGYNDHFQINVSGWRLGSDLISGPPVKPLVIYPGDGESGVPLTTDLAISDFFDPDTGDTHLETQWQISTSSDFSTLVLSEISRIYLKLLPVPSLALKKETTYYWRARVYDNESNPSEWMDTASFSTAVNLNDQNDDGIPDTLENTSVDLDDDGIVDSEQQDIKSLNTVIGNGQIGVSFRNSTTINSIEAIDSIDPVTVSRVARPHVMPLGLLTFRLNVNSPGDTAEVVVYFNEPVPEAAAWYFYNPIKGWTDYSEYTTFSQDRKSITIQLRDGDYGDTDGIANGIIVDPCGYGIASWIKGLVSDQTTHEPIETATVSIRGLDLNLNSVLDGNYLSMILPGIYDLVVSAPGYHSITINDIAVSEADIVTKDIQLEKTNESSTPVDPDCKVKVTGISMSHSPEVNIPVTFTASVQNTCDRPLYYRYSIHPDYGTAGYDGTKWTSMTETEWVSTPSIDYTFMESGKYIIVVWAVTDPDDLGSLTDYIMGFSVSVDDNPCKIVLNGSSITGLQRVYRPLSMTVDATSSCDRPLYYRFSIHPDYGTIFYDGRNWSGITETEWVSTASIDYTFTRPGKYIVVIWISETPGITDSSGIPIIGWCMDIDE